MDRSLENRAAGEEQKQKAENTGVLISSGLIAGGALTAVVIAFIVLGYNLLGTGNEALATSLELKPDEVPSFLDRARGAIGFEAEPWLGLVAFIGVFFALVWLPLRASRNGN